MGDRRIFHVDSFTSTPFGGNPAAVCLLDEEVAEVWMQGVAADMNLSETAFLRRQGDRFSVRYFTPVVEVPLCGHATLASAHILWDEEIVPRDQAISFSAKTGLLAAAREGGWIRLDFPADPVQRVESPKALERALGVAAKATYRTRQPGYLLELDSEETVRSLRPDFALLREGRYGGVITTAACESPSCDFVSRFFGPDFGIDEDPVTGAAHCSLTPFWAERLGKRELIARQVSRRGGVLRLRDRSDRVDIMGQAVTICRGRLVV